MRQKSSDIEFAMRQAEQAAKAQGITDPAKIREAMHAARRNLLTDNDERALVEKVMEEVRARR